MNWTQQHWLTVALAGAAFAAAGTQVSAHHAFGADLTPTGL